VLQKSQKGDPIAVLKKQLEEKERALQEEQQLAVTANNRAKDLRNELNAERSKMASVEKHFQVRQRLYSMALPAQYYILVFFYQQLVGCLGDRSSRLFGWLEGEWSKII
jgi:hypothetical protein